MSFFCKLFKHNFEPIISFSAGLEQKSLDGKTTKKWDEEIWRGYVCERCGKRKIEQLYDTISLPGQNQKAFDWLHEKSKRYDLLEELRK